MMSKIYAACYDTLYVFNSKEQAKKFFGTCYYSSEGAEKERYAAILADLNFSNIGKDNISKYISDISIKINNNENNYLKVSLAEELSIEDSIKYYEEKIKSVIEISDKYNIDFNNYHPFQDFGSDEESFFNRSFSEYYNEICKKIDISISDITTEEISDGKYILMVDGNDITQISAWDTLENVMETINDLNELSKDKCKEI